MTEEPTDSAPATDLGAWVSMLSDLPPWVAWAFVFVLAVLAYFVGRRSLRIIEFFVRKTSVHWDDVVYDRGIFSALAWLAPALVAYYGAFVFSPEVQSIVQRLLLAYMQAVVTLVVIRFVDAMSVLFNRSQHADALPIKGFVQVFNILIFLVASIIIFATVLHRSPWGLLSGLGAVTAVLVLIFKDTILAFVASIQITTNDMVRVGDWITFPKFDADGDVIDIALHTVKIQNFDKTISNIPTQRFIEEGFKNWRGMRRSGGRRIKQAIYVDMTSVRFLDPGLEARLAKLPLLRNEWAGSTPDPVTNLGAFRAYAVAYLRAHPQVHQDGLTFLVRQLPPGSDGLGVEIYVFSKEQRWAPYETIQADIVAHLLATLPTFDLRVFQNPTGADIRRLKPPFVG